MLPSILNYNFDEHRTAVFIDGANLWHTANSMDFKVDFDGLREFLDEHFHLRRMYYYTAIHEDEVGHQNVRKLVDWLSFNGYAVVTKMAKTYRSQTTERIKGNMDIELVVDMVRMAPKLDLIILFSGDGDFCAAVKAAQDQGARVLVVSTITTSPPMVADTLRKQADGFIDLSDLVPHIRRSADVAKR